MGIPTRSFTREQRMPIISGMLAFVLIIVVARTPDIKALTVLR